jgi:TetR/AcrR family transcriptional regulator
MPGRATAAKPRSRIEQKRSKRKAEIVHAALGAFRDKGFHQTTLDDIAQRLGMRPSALYHYFPDKESLLYHCHLESLDEVMRLLEEAQTRFTRADERLAYLIREHVRVMTETLEASPLAFEVTALSPERAAEVIALRDRYERGLRAILSQGKRDGTFRDVNPKTAVFAILGAINWIARWFHPDGDVDSRRLGAEFADLLVGGLTCR